jgi:hypothetical protein
MQTLAPDFFHPLTNPQPYQRERDKPRQGVVANTKVYRNGAIGFIALSATRSMRHIFGCASQAQVSPNEVDVDRCGLVLTGGVGAGLIDRQQIF